VGGKKAFAEAWWQSIDWAAVAYSTKVAMPGLQTEVHPPPLKAALGEPRPEQTRVFKGDLAPNPEPKDIPDGMS
jgi:hypothetical protein